VPTVQYGTRQIQYSHIIDNVLKNAYITVDFYEGVILKSPSISEAKAVETIYKKGKWILEKLKLVERTPQGEIITGSRLLYLGKRYYVQVVQDAGVRTASVSFNHSKFSIYLNPNIPDRNKSIDKALDTFSKEKAKLKITPRIHKWSQITGLKHRGISFRRLDKRWGSCTPSNEIIINSDAIKLPFTVIDYIIVHELAHIKHKHHSKKFDEEVAKFIPDWKNLDEMLCGMKL
jgi:predicted metal-dependent hydrolase